MKNNLIMRIVICPNCGRKLRLLSSVKVIPAHKRRDNPSQPCDGNGSPITEK